MMHILLKLGACACLPLIVTSCAKKEPQHRPPPRVEVASVVQKKLPVTVEAIGHLTAYNAAEIKAQVQGELTEIYYTEGRDVAQGDLLLTIDPRPYEAELASAEAQRRENMASLEFAQDRVRRYETLVSSNYVSQLHYDEYVSKAKEYSALIEKNSADIDRAKINVGYCYIRAPFSGRIGKKLVDKGNLVTDDGSTLLTIKQLDPLYVDFTISERDIYTVQRHQKKGELSLHITLPDEPKRPFNGKLTVINNHVDESTGMVKLRGELDNPNKLLWPGQFVRVAVTLCENPSALLVPINAVHQGQKGKFVYVIDDDNTAHYRKVITGKTHGEYRIIHKGVESGERVITKGAVNVRPHAKVHIAQDTP